MLTIQQILPGIRQLFYPHICKGCGSDLIDDSQLICLRCMRALPYTRFANQPNNPIEKIFWGRLPVKAAHSEFYFSKDSLMQQLIHQLKYNQQQAMGLYLGQLMGTSLLHSSRFAEVEILVPLPLHPAKEKKRGYNQAAIIAAGVASIMNLPVSKQNVIRKNATATQTKKHRIERWENVVDSFSVIRPQELEGKGILLIDDVLTTGATMEACGRAILNAANCTLSMATLAIAEK